MDNNIQINNQNQEWFENPLLYFENLIYYRGFIRVRNSFIDVSEEQESGVSIYYDKDNDTTIYHNIDNETGEEYTITTTFSQHFNRILTTEYTKTLKKTNEILLNLRVREHKLEFVESILSDVDFLIEILSRFEPANKYSDIEKILRSIQNHVKVRNQRLLGVKKIELEKDSFIDNLQLISQKQAEIRKDITENKLKLAFDKLEKHFENDNDLRDRCLLYLARLNSYQKGLNDIGQQDKEEFNNLTTNALDMVRKME